MWKKEESIMNEILFEEIQGMQGPYRSELRRLLKKLVMPFHRGDRVGIKLHWGERGNKSFLPPDYAREIAQWLQEGGVRPFLFDTTVLYSGGRRKAEDSLQTAVEHGYTESFLGCPVTIADGMGGRCVIDLPAGYRHFAHVQVADIFDQTDGFVIFSHFKGHMEAGFGGAIKNLSMGFASRAQKQRMHADVRPLLMPEKCTKCGTCVEVCPTGAAQFGDDGLPFYDHEVCIGCAQCIGFCPALALKIHWETDAAVFQEKLVETAAAVWRQIEGRSVLINALLNITTECDCWPGENPVIHADRGFMGAYHPVRIDEESIRIVGENTFNQAHPDIPWSRQFSYAGEIGF
ncbi:ferridoxin [Syntrophus aciditrophicus SB]|uniref:Ferridoxin n=2 Tax=Syntrophus TaxID=43773 RepID=Q2LTD4_SYNAS|nr:ferridoxin [Syntrophus aciditrophicus SB]